MNKGKNKGKIQKSRQNAEGREAGSFLGKAFDSYHKFLSNKVINFVINMILAIGTVLPFMMKMCNKVAFTYEVNDDGSYCTGFRWILIQEPRMDMRFL